MERVYEIGRVFRNEGVDTRHNPEFTLMELYQAYTDYEGMMELTESMFRYLAEKVCGSAMISYNGTVIDMAKPFERISMIDAVKKYAGVDFSEVKTDEEAKALALPVDEINSIPNNIKDKRAAAVILSNYVSIKDSLYSLEISKEEAQKIGIDADLYISILEDLNNSNRAIKEARLQGKKISLPNVKEEYKEYRQSLQVQQAHMRSGNNGRN